MLEPMKAKLTVPGRSLPARVFDQSSLGILLAHLDGLILEANDAFLFLVDRGRDEVVGHTIGELGFFSSMGDDRAKDLLRERGAIDGFDAHVLTPSGEARVLRLWAEAIADGDDRIVVVRASDDAGRVAAGARYYELREAEVRYRALVEQIPAITYTEIEDETSPIGYRDVYISPQCEHILGYTPFEWQADPELWIRAMHPDDRDRVVRDDRASLETGTFTSEYRMLARDGRVVWFLDEATAVRDQNEHPFVLQGVMYDISERKRSEQELKEVLEKLRAMDRLKNTLLHTLSHDLQNPLTAIHGAASTLERLDSQLSTEERSSLLKSLAGRTQSLRTLLTDLLDLDRLDRGIVEPRRSPG